MMNSQECDGYLGSASDDDGTSVMAVDNFEVELEFDDQDLEHGFQTQRSNLNTERKLVTDTAQSPRYQPPYEGGRGISRSRNSTNSENYPRKPTPI